MLIIADNVDNVGNVDNVDNNLDKNLDNRPHIIAGSWEGASEKMKRPNICYFVANLRFVVINAIF